MQHIDSTSPPPVFQNEETLNLRDYLAILWDGWKIVLVCFCAGLAIGLYQAWTAVPLYRSDALIQVEQKSGSTFTAIDPVNAYFGGQKRSTGEVEIIRSRAVMQGAVDSLNLGVVIQPRHLGAAGATFARRNRDSKQPVSPPLLGLSAYAWGGEQIKVTRFEVPRELEGHGFTLIAGAEGAYELRHTGGATVLNGVVGQAASADMETGMIGIYVSDLVARSGTEFIVYRRSDLDAITELQGHLRVSEKGSGPAAVYGTGIVQLSMDGTVPAEITKALNSIAETYLRQNVERQSEEAANILKFLDEQLPKVKEQLDLAEKRLRDYQSVKGTVDLGKEASAMLEKLTEVETQISALNLEQSELRQKYTDEHPAMISHRAKYGRLAQEKAGVEQQLKKLPATESDFLQLTRDVTVSNELYQLLLNKAQEFRMAKAGITGYVRIIDYAYLPRSPYKPDRLKIWGGYAIAGLFAGILLVFFRHAVRHVVESPEIIERQLGLPVYAAIPHSSRETMSFGARTSAGAATPRILARTDPQDNAVESLRSLRTSLQFALIDSKNNVVTISGPTPDLGKSFVAVNLSCLLADMGKRVLLVDGDMRKGKLHRYFGLDRSPGLSEAISGQCKLDQAIRAVDDGKLHFISTGTIPPNPSELLIGDHFTRLVQEVSKKFDLVIFDTPPILNLTDGTVIARHCGTTFLVVRAGVSNLSEIEQSVKQLRQNDIKLSGTIFNDLKVGLGKYGYGKYRYYSYRYDSKAATL